MHTDNNKSPTGGVKPIFVYEGHTLFVVFDDNFAADVNESHFNPDEWTRVAWPSYRRDERRNAYKQLYDEVGLPSVFHTLYQ